MGVTVNRMLERIVAVNPASTLIFGVGREGVMNGGTSINILVDGRGMTLNGVVVPWITADITVIEKEIRQSLEGSRNVVSQINQIMNGLQMLALNASIEAAKVGVHGKGFMVVADHMAKSVDAVRKMTHEIETMNGNIQKVSEKISLALVHLQ